MTLPAPSELYAGLSLGLLLFARMLPLSLLVPFLTPLPSRPGAALGLSSAIAVVLAVVLYPIAAPLDGANVASLGVLLLLSLREALLGAVYAFAIALPLWSLRWAGQLVDATVFAAPHTPAARALFGELFLWLGVLAFIGLGGHRLVLSALADGVIQHPPGVLSSLQDPATLALSSARLLGDAFSAALLVALPVIVSVLWLELTLALSARVSGLSFVGTLAPELRGLLGLAVVWSGAAVLFYRLPSAFREALAAADRLWDSL